MVMVQLVRSLGWVDNIKKSDLVPRQEFDSLGIHFNLVDYMDYPIEDNLIKLKDCLSTLRAGQELMANQ